MHPRKGGTPYRDGLKSPEYRRHASLHLQGEVMMNKKVTKKVTVMAVALCSGLLGTTLAAMAAESQPTYQSSIRVADQNEGESGEAANLASQAKIDAKQAMSAALAQVPGSVLKVSLDNENGNLVYSVEIKIASNGVKDVKVDAGNGKVLTVDSGGEDNGIEEQGENHSERDD